MRMSTKRQMQILCEREGDLRFLCHENLQECKIRLDQKDTLL